MNESIVGKKSLEFGIRIVKFYQYLCDEKHEYVISKQILRSGTSIGANIRESKNAQSTADFISKLSIALKEADETDYCFDILTGSEIIQESQIKDLKEFNIEIIKMLISIIKTKKGNKIGD